MTLNEVIECISFFIRLLTLSLLALLHFTVFGSCIGICVIPLP